MVYTECDANCVKTCENVNKPKVCNKICAQGCTCPENTYLHGGRCVTANQCPSKQVLLHNSKGSVNKAQNFTCVLHSRMGPNLARICICQ